MANILTIAVEPSSGTNDHQARLLVDGKDWLGPEFLGLDPPMLEAALHGEGAGTLCVGRCWCGSIGCSSVMVEVTRTKDSVHWSGPGATRLSFDAAQYDSEVARFSRDTSWETLGRTVEREVEQIFRGTTIRGGLTFEWASTRIEEGFVRLSFRKGHRWKSLKFRWNGTRVSDAVNQARLFRAERFSHCGPVRGMPG